MSRLTAEKTTATPYLALWDAADPDLTSTDVNQSPVDITKAVAGNINYIRLGISGAVASQSILWHIIITDEAVRDAAGNPLVIQVVEWRSTATARRSASAGAAGQYIHQAAEGHGDLINIKGAGTRGARLRIYLALVNIDSDTAIHLTRIETFNKAL